MVTWGADSSGGTQKTALGQTESFFDKVDMSSALAAQVEILANNENATSVTDALEIKVYLTLDAATEDWDDASFMGFSFEPTSINEEKTSFIVPPVYAFRVGVASAGATDTYTVDMNYRLRTA